MNNLFQYKKFTLHSGGTSCFKIECDALTDEDYKTFARIISQKVKFKEVHGVPRGGVPFENALREYATNDNNNLLIVDDVFTTGGSMEEAKKQFLDKGFDEILGIVVFARKKCPGWINSIFELQKFFGEDV
jgi:orotate phosphoribosyltransferase